MMSWANNSIYTLSGLSADLSSIIDQTAVNGSKMGWISPLDVQHVIDHTRNNLAFPADSRLNGICPMCTHTFNCKKVGAIVGEVNKKYPAAEFPYLFHVSFRVPRGQTRFGLVDERRILDDSTRRDYEDILKRICGNKSAVLRYHGIDNNLIVHSHFHVILALPSNPADLEVVLARRWRDAVAEYSGANHTDAFSVRAFPVDRKSLFIRVYYIYRPIFRPWHLIDVDVDRAKMRIYKNKQNFVQFPYKRAYLDGLFSDRWQICV